jgi:hypothetical protein
VFAQETRVPPPGIESPSLGDQFAQSNVPNCRATTGQGDHGAGRGDPYDAWGGGRVLDPNPDRILNPGN